jgi:hypothetical protein
VKYTAFINTKKNNTTVSKKLMLLALVGLFFLPAGFTGFCFAQDPKTERVEYLTVRVQYGKDFYGFKYEVYVDIGNSGAHSLSGHITNGDKSVTITDDNGVYEFKSDMDLVNYFAKNGWEIIHTGEIEILDQHYYTYIMERRFVK